MYLALREMRFAKTRYALIMTIMLLVSFLVMFVTGLAKGLAYANASSIENIPADYFVVQSDASQRFSRSEVGTSVIDEVRNVVGNSHAAVLGVQMATVTHDGASQKIDVTFFAAESDSWIMPDVVEGSGISSYASGEVLVDQKLKESGVQLGSVIHDQTSGMAWTVAGFTRNESYSHTPVIFMNEQEWQNWKQKISKSVQASGNAAYNTLAIKASSSQADQLKSKLPEMEIMSKSTAVSAIPGYKEEQGSLLMMIAFLYFISGFVLAVFFYVITIQKTSQFGILKAMGTGSGYLAASVLGQVMLLTVASLFISILIIQVASRLLPDSMPFQLSGSTIGLTGCLFVIMAMAGSVISIMKVNRVDALEAIGRVSA
ncbi:ABC transporter permease [Paenibacillus zeisoli]|uniref:Putative hemin transport system permease protein HrtB n=1 Tax=Paenibacillus zeisoli TaxID=2496267 RepID=A0A433XPH6_9BACL|nr:ABC transporter permease [Paenibacillus zeisoli]RUT35993.1 ABC transporter permease [Paenibacillus zeisoli]